MRYPYLIAFASLLAMPTVSTYSQEPTADQRLIPDRSSGSHPKATTNKRLPKGLFGQSSLMHFRLRGGRLQLDPVRYRKGKQSFHCDAFEESITVSCTGGVPSAYYQYQDSYQQVRLSAEYGKSLRIESVILATGERAVLRQESSDTIGWTTQRDPGVESPLDTRVNGATLLHIVAGDEAGYQVHLEHVIKRLLRGRSVVEIAKRTQRHLVRNSKRLAVVSRSDVDDWIQQLGADHASQRRSAAIALTRLAAAAVPHLLNALATEQLDPEQASRIRTILATQGRHDDDTPASLACLLSTDRTHWQFMAHRMDQQQWRDANEHLQLCGLTQLKR